MAATYEPIATTTLGSAASSITFSSIPSTYTDLRLVLVGKASAVANPYQMQFNSDTSGSSTNYSTTQLYGNGSSVASNRYTSTSQINIGDDLSGQSNTIPSATFVDIFSYAGSTYKTILCNAVQDKNGSGTVFCNVGLWRSTAAITTITLTDVGTTFATGTTATLYGITKA